jgi:hypothetical protein
MVRANNGRNKYWLLAWKRSESNRSTEETVVLEFTGSTPICDPKFELISKP